MQNNFQVVNSKAEWMKKCIQIKLLLKFIHNKIFKVLSKIYCSFLQ